ncbi:MAG TPA: hypothetical protein VM935_15200 [Chitinophagaceae bacterium]|nr:hypothetical protein [Chitinophagaceae bacterium]
MKCCILILFVLLSGWTSAQDEEAILKKVKAKLDRVSDYQAKGTMNVDVSFINAPKSGVAVFYKKPDRFRINKSGGISLLPKGGLSINMGSLLGASNYTTVPAGTAMVKGISARVLKLLPLEENSDVVLTTLYVDVPNALILKAAVTTKENGSYELDMDYGKYASWGLPDKVNFTFNTKDYKLPKGITFEYEKGDKKAAAPMKAKKGRIEINYSSYIINKGVDDAVFKK